MFEIFKMFNNLRTDDRITLPIISLLCGLIYPLSFAPFEYRWIVFVALSGLLFTLFNSKTVKQAVIIGWLFGVGVFTTGMYWFYHALSIFGEANALISFILSALFIVFLASFFALFGYISFQLKSRTTKFQWFVFIPIVWGVFEIFRSWFLTGIPWLLSGVTQIDGFLNGWLPIVGVFGVGGLTMAISSFSVGLIACKKNLSRAILLSMMASIFIASYVVKDIRWTKSLDTTLSVALVQGNVKQSLKFQKGLLIDTLKTYTSLSKAHLNNDLIIWPETAIPAVIDNVEDWLKPHIKQYKNNNVQVLTGLFTTDKNGTGYQNSLIDLTDFTNNYKKVHLVPLGEYIPFRSLFSFVAKYVQIPMSDLIPGEKNQPLLKIGHYKAGVSICFESAYSRLFVNKQESPNFYINISNDAWFADTSAPWQHLEIARSRVMEYQKPMLRVTNNGVSAIINANGTLVVKSKQFEQQVLTGLINPAIGETPYTYLKNWPMFVLLFLILSYVLFRKRVS